jgi:hypothetical protein
MQDLMSKLSWKFTLIIVLYAWFEIIMSWIKRGLDKLDKVLEFGGGHFGATTLILPCYLDVIS